MVDNKKVDAHNMDLIAEYVSAVGHFHAAGHWHAFMGVEMDAVPQEPALHQYSWEMTPQEQEAFGEVRE